MGRPHHRRHARAAILSGVVTVAIAVGLVGCARNDSAVPTPTRSTPSATAIKAAPTRATITCTKTGTVASPPVVAVSPRGVTLVVRNTSGKPRVIGYRVTPFPGGPQTLGTITPTAASKGAIFRIPPGWMDLRCGTSANTGLDETVSLTLVDRRRYYNDINELTTLGCTPAPLSPAKDFIDRATRKEALQLSSNQLPSPGKYTFTDGAGYRSDPVSRHLVFRSGKGFGVIEVRELANLSFTAALVARC